MELPLDGLPGRAVPDDRDRDPRHPAQHAQPLDLLLRRDPADVADDDLPVRREPLPEGDGVGRAPVVRVIPLQVHAAPPAGQPADPGLAEVVLAGRRGDEGDIGALVHPAHVLPGDGGGHPEPVAARESGDVGLIDGDRGHADPVGGGDGLRPQEEGRGRMQHVRLEPGEDPLHLRAGQPDRELPVRDGGHLVDAVPRVLLRRPGLRTDDDRFVALRGQMIEHPEDAGGHPVHCGEEALADDGDPHDLSVAAGNVPTVNGRCPEPLAILSS